VNTPLTIGAVVVAGAALLFGLKECEGRRDARADAEAQRQDSIAAVQHAAAIAQRDAALIEVAHLREEVADARAFQAQTASSIAQLTVAYNRISRNVGGGGELPRDTSRGDSAEVIGARTLALIDSQNVVIARQDTTIRRDSVTIDRLFAVTDSLGSAFAHLDTAYQARTREAEIYKRQRYGWKDRVTVNACYGILVTGETGFCGSIAYTLVRPLRAVDSVTGLVRRVF
jgi:hypothetical protein